MTLTLHPAALSLETLEAQCGLRTQRRSGPGGQHRNKTSSGVFLHHEPTGVVAEATERRSQADNRGVALQRLRFKLALQVRTASPLDGPIDPVEQQARQSLVGVSMKMAESNPRKPALLAFVLNDLAACGGQPREVAPLWKTTTSGIVRLLKSHPAAFALANEIRQRHQRPALK